MVFLYGGRVLRHGGPVSITVSSLSTGWVVPAYLVNIYAVLQFPVWLMAVFTFRVLLWGYLMVSHSRTGAHR